MITLPKEVETALDQMLAANLVTDADRAHVIGAATPDEALNRLQDLMKRLGAAQVETSPPLNIADYYREGPGNYDRLWEIQAPLPCRFEDLDRKTRFFVLFQEWSRRELQGLTALGAGQTGAAAAIFEECVERGRQLQVNELVARSYENLVRVAEKGNEHEAMRRYLKEVKLARGDE